MRACERSRIRWNLAQSGISCLDQTKVNDWLRSKRCYVKQSIFFGETVKAHRSTAPKATRIVMERVYLINVPERTLSDEHCQLLIGGCRLNDSAHQLPIGNWQSSIGNVRVLVLYCAPPTQTLVSSRAQ